MSLRLRSYTEYRNSELPWLGQIPAHWSTERLDRLFRLRNESPEADDQRVTGYIDGRVTLRSNVQGQKIKGVIKEAGWQRIYPGDFAISGMNAHLGGMGVSDALGKCSPIYLVLEPLPGTDANFISNVVRYTAHIGLLKTLVNTIRFNSADFKRDDLKLMTVWLPSATEQAQIVRFIAFVNSRTNRLIRAKRRLITILTEQKQGIIHRAVTRGLDPDMPLKPSGVEWLGDVPKHWVVKPLKHWVEINKRVLPETTDKEYCFRYLDIGSVGTGFLIQEPEFLRFAEAPSRARRVLMKGDTIISTVRTYLKAVHFIADETQDLIASTGFAVLTPRSLVEPSLLRFLILSKTFVDRVTAHSIGIAYPAISETRLAAFHVAIPPTRIEQLAIAEHIEKEASVVDKAVRRAQQEIDIIREYRSRLIGDVVIGKLDVRGVELPADSYETAVGPPDDLEEGIEPGEAELELEEEALAVD